MLFSIAVQVCCTALLVNGVKCPMPAPEAAAIAAELRTAMGKLTRRVKHEDRIPLGQVAVLGALDRDGAMTISDLAADQRVRPQSMARTVGLLIEQNLLTRRAHPTDRRKSLVDLSDMGQAALEAERGRRAGWLAQAIDAELTDEERALLARSAALLERLATR
ncbi:DNA-binding MarR family transcriptional regulator [Micromonospora pisi]|uniref:DNA-binding MarR family transcriptional regulator n=1 Tax=Micromonospora pisi TaxID=589240 RepID=A0A495JSC8_9ACTN|nr:MarR family transcriptional regulator [Micromonospora pisi]RKR91515.1 DNA-binding MarR family transcriptional regulator [Micromonospora pisi]